MRGRGAEATILGALAVTRAQGSCSLRIYSPACPLAAINSAHAADIARRFLSASPSAACAPPRGRPPRAGRHRSKQNLGDDGDETQTKWGRTSGGRAVPRWDGRSSWALRRPWKPRRDVAAGPRPEILAPQTEIGLTGSRSRRRAVTVSCCALVDVLVHPFIRARVCRPGGGEPRTR